MKYSLGISNFLKEISSLSLSVVLSIKSSDIINENDLEILNLLVSLFSLGLLAQFSLLLMWHWDKR